MLIADVNNNFQKNYEVDNKCLISTLNMLPIFTAYVKQILKINLKSN